MRVFVALPVSENVRRQLTAVQEKVAGIGAVKLVEPENIHLTLKFLGEVGEGKLGEIRAGLRGASECRPFVFTLGGVGVFPKPSYVRVVWAGVCEGKKEVTELHGRVDRLLEPLGFLPDKKFHPHATLARVKHLGEKKGLYMLLDENRGKTFGSCTASEIRLMESQLTPKGPGYTVLEHVPLKGNI